MIGDLDQRVTIEARTRTPDAGGGASIAWTLIAAIWAQVTPAAAGELTSAEARGASASYRLSIRRRSDVIPGQSAVWAGKRLYIRAIRDPGPRQSLIDLICDDADPL